MSQITKIMLRIIMNRIKNEVREQVSFEQYGFLVGKGTTNAIFALRIFFRNKCVPLFHRF